jgi:hypothetical protein
MMHRGDGDGGCVEVEIGGQQFVDGGENGNCVFGRGIGGAGCVRLDGGDEGNAEPRGFQFAVNAEMVFAEGSVSGDGNAQNVFAGYCAAPFSGALPSTALRQRL